MASTPKMEYQVFLCIFLKNSFMATLWENSVGKVGKKVCPVGCLSLVLLNWDSQQGRPFSLPSQRNFPISFKPKVAIAEFFWKMQRKTWYSILGVDAMPLSLKNLLLRQGSARKPIGRSGNTLTTSPPKLQTYRRTWPTVRPIGREEQQNLTRYFFNSKRLLLQPPLALERRAWQVPKRYGTVVDFLLAYYKIGQTIVNYSCLMSGKL